METNRLRQFVVVVDTGNLRRAAELLAISHSGLSKSLRVLQDDLGVPLLAASGRGVRVTEAGRAFYDRAVEMLFQMEMIFGAPLAASKAIETKLKLATSEIFSTYFLAGLLQEQPCDQDLCLHEMIPGKMEDALLSKKVDVIVTYLPVVKPGIDFRKVGEMQMGVFALAGAFSGKPARELPFVVPVDSANGTAAGQTCLDGWPDRLFLRRVKFEVSLLESAMHLCRAGRAAVSIPKFLASLSNASHAPHQQLAARGVWRRGGEPKIGIYLGARTAFADHITLRRLTNALSEIM